MPGRGTDPGDGRWFSGTALPTLRAAHAELRWLLDRGYPLDPALAFVGGHHQLAARQREALRRATASTAQAAARAASRLPLSAVREGPLLLDGLNLIITLETASDGGLLVRGDDGVVRDLAGLRGSYRPIPATDAALAALGDALQELRAPAVGILLDAPVSNSGELRKRILARSAEWRIPIDVRLVPDADPVLASGARIVTADSVVLDRAAGWFDLGSWIVGTRMPDARVVDLAGGRDAGD